MNPRTLRRAVQLLLVGVAAYYAVLGGEYSAFDLVRLSSMQAEEEAALEASRAEVAVLRATAERLEHDPVTIERVARERFGMIRKGERLYRFVEVDTSVAPIVRVARTP